MFAVVFEFYSVPQWGLPLQDAPDGYLVLL